MWEKTKHFVRGTDYGDGSINPAVFFEVLASRAQTYFERTGVDIYGGLAVFDADRAVVASVNKRIREARGILTAVD